MTTPARSSSAHIRDADIIVAKWAGAGGGCGTALGTAGGSDSDAGSGAAVAADTVVGCPVVVATAELGPVVVVDVCKARVVVDIPAEGGTTSGV